MNRSEHLRHAAQKLEEAIAKLKAAKQSLLQARSDQHVPLAVQLVALEEIYSILTDPVCTPEMFEQEDAPGPDWGDFDDCRWDGGRIEATKTLLFQEYIGRR